jgi:hypothetical protein
MVMTMLWRTFKLTGVIWFLFAIWRACVALATTTTTTMTTTTLLHYLFL